MSNSHNNVAYPPQPPPQPIPPYSTMSPQFLNSTSMELTHQPADPGSAQQPTFTLLQTPDYQNLDLADPDLDTVFSLIEDYGHHNNIGSNQADIVRYLYEVESAVEDHPSLQPQHNVVEPSAVAEGLNSR